MLNFLKKMNKKEKGCVATTFIVNNKENKQVIAYISKEDCYHKGEVNGYVYSIFEPLDEDLKEYKVAILHNRKSYEIVFDYSILEYELTKNQLYYLNILSSFIFNKENKYVFSKRK